MNLNLNYKGYKPYLVSRSSFAEYMEKKGIQYIFRFPNNYGASVVKQCDSYGFENDLWELAVLTFATESGVFDICYDTYITGDVLGWLSDKQVRKTLHKIQNL